MNAGALDTLASCLIDLLQRPVLRIALRQRAKFEGWLKIELANALEARGAIVALESAVPGTRFRADISARFPNNGEVLLMLKTVNTNFRFIGVLQSTRPITKNIAGVVEDLSKLRASSSAAARVAVFPVFPVAQEASDRAAQLTRYIERIRASGGRIEREGFLVQPGSSGDWGVAWYIVGI